MKHLLSGALLALTGLAAADEPVEQAFYNYRSLSLEIANQAAWAALRACREKGYSVAVVVLDRGGNSQAVLRDRLAGPHTVETARRKAWTANSFRQSTSALASLLQEGRIPSQVQHNPGALLVGGGLMIEAAGQVIGGIGVSGAPPGRSEAESIDGECAAQGLAHIEEALAFAD